MQIWNVTNTFYTEGYLWAVLDLWADDTDAVLTCLLGMVPMFQCYQKSLCPWLLPSFSVFLSIVMCEIATPLKKYLDNIWWNWKISRFHLQIFQHIMIISVAFSIQKRLSNILWGRQSLDSSNFWHQEKGSSSIWRLETMGQVHCPQSWGGAGGASKHMNWLSLSPLGVPINSGVTAKWVTPCSVGQRHSFANQTSPEVCYLPRGWIWNAVETLPKLLWQSWLLPCVVLPCGNQWYCQMSLSTSSIFLLIPWFYSFC